VATFYIRLYNSSDIHLCNYCTGEFSTDLTTKNLRFIRFPRVHEIEFVRRVAVILHIWAMRNIIRYLAILSYRAPSSRQSHQTLKPRSIVSPIGLGSFNQSRYTSAVGVPSVEPSVSLGVVLFFSASPKHPSRRYH
jgi:hypothetical protein